MGLKWVEYGFSTGFCPTLFFSGKKSKKNHIMYMFATLPHVKSSFELLWHQMQPFCRDLKILATSKVIVNTF